MSDAPTSNVHQYSVNGAKVNHQRTVRNGMAWKAVTATFNSHQQLALTRKRHGIRDILRSCRPHDQRGMLVVLRIPQPARTVISEIFLQNHKALKALSEFPDRSAFDRCFLSRQSDGSCARWYLS